MPDTTNEEGTVAEYLGDLLEDEDTCEECGTLLTNGENTSPDDCLCRPCWEESHPECEDCGNRHHESETVDDSYSGLTLCGWCRDARHFTCSGCNGCVGCGECGTDGECERDYDEDEDETDSAGLSAWNASPVLGWLAAQPTASLPQPWVTSADGDGWSFRKPREDREHVGRSNAEHPTLLGIELEWERGQNVSERLSTLVGAMRDAVAEQGMTDVSVLKSDGSLRCGGELVLPPAPLEWWQGVGFQKLDAILTAARAAGIRSDGWSTTGMHVHVSQAWVSELHVARALLCLTRGQTFWERVGGRRSTQYADWSGLFWQARRSVWDDYAGTTRHHEGLRGKVKDALAGGLNRYSAVTFRTPHGTSEFRMLKGTIYADRAVRRLEAVSALVDWSRDVARRDTFAAGASGTESLMAFVLGSEDYPLLRAWLTTSDARTGQWNTTNWEN